MVSYLNVSDETENAHVIPLTQTYILCLISYKEQKLYMLFVSRVRSIEELQYCGNDSQ